MSNLKARRRARGSAPTFRVALACNDGDNGLFADRCEGIIVTSKSGESVELDHCRGASPRLTILDGRLRIFRCILTFSTSKEWVGNWCWNEYVMRLDDVARLLKAAIRGGRFSSSGASGDEACRLSGLLDEEVEEYQIRDALLTMAVTNG